MAGDSARKKYPQHASVGGQEMYLLHEFSRKYFTLLNPGDSNAKGEEAQTTRNTEPKENENSAENLVCNEQNGQRKENHAGRMAPGFSRKRRKLSNATAQHLHNFH